MQNVANVEHVTQVSLTELAKDKYAEFPVAVLEATFDAADRKFPAVANAHPAKPPILQATDCKWLMWKSQLAAAGITVEFLCPDDICRFFKATFPERDVPALP
jgi:hypothetical protein